MRARLCDFWVSTLFHNESCNLALRNHVSLITFSNVGFGREKMFQEDQQHFINKLLLIKVKKIEKVFYSDRHSLASIDVVIKQLHVLE